MLGTRIILLGMHQRPGDNSSQPQAEVIAAANHQIPLFWLLGYGSRHIEQFRVEVTDEAIVEHRQGDSYPVLIASRSDYLAHLETVIGNLCNVIQEQDAELLQGWNHYLSQLDYPVLALDTYELWCAKAEGDQLQQELMPLMTITEKLHSPEWQSSYEHLLKQLYWQPGNSIGLCGYGWS